MKDKLLSGEPCDLVILTQALIDQLASQGHVVAGSASALGVVRTGVAIKSGQPVPDVSTAASLKAALHPAQADYLYFVAKPGAIGQHTFSATLDQHESAVKAYRGVR